MRIRLIPVLAALSVLFGATAAQAVNLTAAGYQQNFDAMGTTGTTPPAGWSVLTGNAGTSNATWTTTIPGNGTNSVATLVPTAGALTATAAPSATNNNGFNAARSASATADRVLATSPTTVSGAALQLLLTNATGASFNQLRVGFDTVRFTSVSAANELPGFWLFYSLDGNTWANVAALNPTIATVPNTVGVTSVASSLVSLSAPVAAGGSLWLRWVDDNARQTSPDQIIGLNNVTITAVPEPTSLAMLLAGLGAVVLRRRARRA